MVLSTSQPTCDKKIIEKVFRILLIVNIKFPSHFDQTEVELVGFKQSELTFYSNLKKIDNISSSFDQESRISIRTMNYSENGTNANQHDLLQTDEIVKNLETNLIFVPYPLFSKCKL
ncbi:Protein CBG12438 [Caenorhabditis briggsae]|uniref:Protein CBG12438 n=1 Tax=Caenorhabditis briggsae TaxID=6238 RepID=A8XFF9_CAEBR|nr:Protein CBG12438 [Caenorhabditis briggsae]CAP31420.1 Protein CBG12438 [Caenorhabditis briggsae]